MAVLENITSEPMIFSPYSVDNDYGFVLNPNRASVGSFPQIFLSNGEPWRIANRYAFYRFDDLQKDLKTVHREMTHLARYASWLEDEGLHWLHFPKKKAERCLFRFRGFLVAQRENGILASSTTTQTMNSVVAFYRWASKCGYAESNSELFDNETKVVAFFDRVGFSRTMSVRTSELSIPNRVRTGTRLEEGLTPISQASVKKLMAYLSEHQNYELYLMTKLALQSGCRHETVATMKIDVLKKAYPDHKLFNVMRVKVGPGTDVETKKDVSGEVYVPKPLVNELIEYFNSAEAILRRSKASKSMQRYVFLTNRGNRYTNQTFGTLLYRLKEELIRDGNTEFGRFKFHQLRATFGTMLTRALLQNDRVSALNAIEFVKEAMLHKNASTTWKYIKFVEKEPIEEQFLDTLWSIFTGPEKESNKIIEYFSSNKVFNVN